MKGSVLDNSELVNPLGGWRLRLGVYNRMARRLLVDRIFDPGSTVTLGMHGGNVLVDHGMKTDSLLLVSDGTLLHLLPGMRVHMCNLVGDCHIKGSYEELTARGVDYNEPPNQMPYGIDSGFRDPSGNSVRLTQLNP